MEVSCRPAARDFPRLLSCIEIETYSEVSWVGLAELLRMTLGVKSRALGVQIQTHKFVDFSKLKVFFP